MHIPERIRFECSSCGNCCFQWPVPLTSDDVARIEKLEGTKAHVESGSFDSQLSLLLGKPDNRGFRVLNTGDQKYRGFTHTLEKRDDGRCRFLNQDTRCSLHQEHGQAAKPSMCRLFPHAFSSTPSGYFAYVSFASSAVLANQGRLLKDQQELLAQRLELYIELFKDVKPDWSKLQILDGHPLSWEKFLSIEAQMLKLFDDESSRSPIDTLLELSRLVCLNLPEGANPEKLPKLETSPQTVDRIILKHLHNTYLPDDVFACGDFDLDARLLMTEIVQNPGDIAFGDAEFDKLANTSLENLAPEIDDLLCRFIYARLFAKLYFGPNLAHLSLLSGIHHLFFVVALLRLKMKQHLLANKSLSFSEAKEILRVIERRLSQMNFSSQSSAVMEVLFSSPSRLERLACLIR